MGLAGDRLCVMKQQSLFTISHNNTHSYIIIIHLWSALSDVLPNFLINTSGHSQSLERNFKPQLTNDKVRKKC